jgi:RNA polymerase sigma factor (TIGR02999 family)
MPDVTQILSRIDSGDPTAAEQLLPLVYDELRRLASQKLAHEKPGQTLEATALVHEAYLRLVKSEGVQHWSSRRHFFLAAAESMRRILVENARRKKRLKRGGDRKRIDLPEQLTLDESSSDELLDLDAALERFGQVEADKAEVVKLHFFAGLKLSDIAQLLGLSEVTVKRHWRYARAWLHKDLTRGSDGNSVR